MLSSQVERETKMYAPIFKGKEEGKSPHKVLTCAMQAHPKKKKTENALLLPYMFCIVDVFCRYVA